MGPNEKQKIEIEKLHRDPLPPLNQAVKADYSDFLGTALILPARSFWMSFQCILATR